MSTMMKEMATQIVKESFLEMALCMEAIFLIHEVEEEVVEEIVKAMEEVYGNAMKGLKRAQGSRSPEKQGHTRCANSYRAVEGFISRLMGHWVENRKATKTSGNSHLLEMNGV